MNAAEILKIKELAVSFFVNQDIMKAKISRCQNVVIIRKLLRQIRSRTIGRW